MEEEESKRKLPAGQHKKQEKGPVSAAEGIERPEQEGRERLERLHGWNRRGNGRMGM